MVSKIEADAFPIMWIALVSDRHTPMDLTDYADRYLTDPLKALPGVATAIIGGERKYSMRVWLDRERLAAQGLTATDVEDALKRQNLDSPGGRIESTDREFTVLAETDLRTPEEFNDMIISEVNGYPIQLKDVGYAKPGPYENRKIVRVNGTNGVALGVVKQSTANTLEVARGVKALLPRLEAGLPEGVRMWLAVDTSLFVEASINAVYRTLVEAMVLVVLVIFLFLRELARHADSGGHHSGVADRHVFLRLRARLLGQRADDARASCSRWASWSTTPSSCWRTSTATSRRACRPTKAALQGSKEIGFAVIAMTITLATVFTPLVFMTGRTGQLFTEFALTVSAAVLVSGFVALSLTPMMCSKLLKHDARTARSTTCPSASSRE